MINVSSVRTGAVKTCKKLCNTIATTKPQAIFPPIKPCQAGRQEQRKAIGLLAPTRNPVCTAVKPFSEPKNLYECLEDISIEPSVLNRMIKLNYPIELMDLSYRIEKSMPQTIVSVPKIKIEDIGRGKDLLQWYQSSLENCSSINNALRKSEPITGKAKEVMEFMDTHQRPIGKDTVLIRGSSYIDDVKIGDVITDKGFMSAMERKGCPDVLDGSIGFCGYFKDFLVIKTNANQKVIVPADWTNLEAQAERILPRGTSLRVIDVKKLTDKGLRSVPAIENRRAIVCEIIPAS